ncbi:hypothetical protein [Marinomonas flavescens]|uniref:hypothetical protein n=1 Tax=Marinomonas flavescens TaxID=2529379 RepID=UPI0010541CBA|nr:hypothetical protein [Marinomonas flavescens]
MNSQYIEPGICLFYEQLEGHDLDGKNTFDKAISFKKYNSQPRRQPEEPIAANKESYLQIFFLTKR